MPVPAEFDIEITATLTMEKTDAGFTITAIHLDVKARVPKGRAVKAQYAPELQKIGFGAIHVEYSRDAATAR